MFKFGILKISLLAVAFLWTTNIYGKCQERNKYQSQLSNKYKEKKCPTPNYDHNRCNTVEGVILHHTAEPTIERSLEILTSLKKKVGTHIWVNTWEILTRNRL